MRRRSTEFLYYGTAFAGQRARGPDSTGGREFWCRPSGTLPGPHVTWEEGSQSERRSGWAVLSITTGLTIIWSRLSGANH